MSEERSDTHGTGRPAMSASAFEAHVELLDFFVGHRDAIVARIQEVLNAEHKPAQFRTDRDALVRHFEDCFFALPGITPERARLRGELEQAHWSRGFKPREMREMPNDLLQPADLLTRAFVMWQSTRWPGRTRRVYGAHALFDLYLVRQLALLAMRALDARSGAAAERLSRAQRVLDRLSREGPADRPPLVRDVRWLIPVALSPTTDDLAPYFEVAEEIEAAFADADRLETLNATVRLAGGHLRSYLHFQVVQKGVPLGDSGLVVLTRKSNALDFSLLIHGLVALLDGYERAVESGDGGKRLEWAEAVCQGVSPDPDLLVNRLDLLCAYTMVEHLFAATDGAGQAVYTPLGRRHVALLEEYAARMSRVAKPLYDDCRNFRPPKRGYSPYGVVYGAAANLLEHIAFKALERDAVARYGLEDAFTAGDADKLAWVSGLRKLPHIDRKVQRLYAYPERLAEELFARVEAALRVRAAGGDASALTPTGRLFVCAGEAEADPKAAVIPDLPARYVGSSDIRVVAAGGATAMSREQLEESRAEAHVLVSYETAGGWVVITKDLLTEVLGAGRDVKVAGLPAAAAERLRLMCGGLVSR